MFTLLSSLNARVVIVGRDESKLEETSLLLAGSGHRIEPFDFLATEKIASWVKRSLERLDRCMASFTLLGIN